MFIYVYIYVYICLPSYIVFTSIYTYTLPYYTYVRTYKCICTGLSCKYNVPLTTVLRVLFGLLFQVHKYIADIYTTLGKNIPINTRACLSNDVHVKFLYTYLHFVYLIHFRWNK